VSLLLLLQNSIAHGSWTIVMATKGGQPSSILGALADNTHQDIVCPFADVSKGQSTPQQPKRVLALTHPALVG
jgi:hypothetical protein